MLADQPMLHNAITALLVYLQIGSLVWMFVYSRGWLASVYASESCSTDSPVSDFLDKAGVTILLIAGWPAMLIELARGALR